MRPNMTAIAIFNGNCREIGELGFVAGLTRTILSVRDPELRMNALSVQGAAFAAIVAFAGLLLRAEIESRSRS
jgi:hypothetical protein